VSSSCIQLPFGDDHCILKPEHMPSREDDYVPVKERRAKLASRRRARDDGQAARESPQPDAVQAQPIPDAPPQRPQASLLKASAVARHNKPAETDAEKQAKEEKAFMESLMKKQALRSAQENAQSIEYTEPLSTGWTAPSWYAHNARQRLDMLWFDLCEMYTYLFAVRFAQ